MNHVEDWLSRLSPPRRNSFFPGKMMGVAQFEREQRYGMGQRWLMNRLTLGTGILCGLEVSVIEGKRLRIEPGVAVDPWGREIVVARRVEYDPFKAGGGDCGCGEGPAISTAGDYLVCLTYRECTTDDLPVQYADDCSGQPDCQPDTTVESYAIGVRDGKSIPAGFDCGAWTLPVKTQGAEEKPPSIAVLRERLAQQFGTSCGKPPGDGCVALGLITVAKENAAWSLSLPSGFAKPRVQLYSQAQMLEMILCLANCCTGGHTDPIPTTKETLRVEKVEVVAFDSDVTPPRLVALVPAKNTKPPAFLPASETDPARVPLALRVTFNQPIDTGSIPDPIAGSTSNSIRLVRAAKPQDLELRVIAVTEQPNVVIILGIAPSTGLQIESRVGVSAVLGAASAMGPLGPGLYTLTLRGDNVSAHTAIVSWPPAVSQALDGEWGEADKFPDVEEDPDARSGNEVAGGDLVVRFEIRDTLRLSGITTNQGSVTSTADPVPLQWSKSGIEVALLFNRAVDQKTLAKGITVTLPDGTSPKAKSIKTELDGTRAVVTYPAGRTDAFPQPGVDESYIAIVTLSGSTGGIAEPAAAGSTAFDGDPTANDELPTGDGVSGGDFTFMLTIIP